MAAQRRRPARALGPQALRAVRGRGAGRRRAAGSTTGAPLLHGGGAVKLVTLDEVSGRRRPSVTRRARRTSSASSRSRPPAGACARTGWRPIAAHERALAARLWRGLDGVPGPAHAAAVAVAAVERVGLASFTLDGHRHPLLAAVLSAEHAIGVRHGCFCAHPLIARLLAIPDRETARLERELAAGRHPQLPGAVRASIGLGTTVADIDRLTEALRGIAGVGAALALSPRGRARWVHARRDAN